MFIKEMFHFIEAIKETISNKTIKYLLYTLIKLLSFFQLTLTQYEVFIKQNLLYN